MKFAYLIEPPFNYRDKTGSVTGCDVEVAKYVLTQIGDEDFEPVETEYSELLPGVAKGRWRMTTGLFATPERAQFVKFSCPVWALRDGLLVRRGNPFSLGGYRSVAEAADCSLAVIQDQFQHRSAVEFGISEERILVFNTYTEAAEAVRDGLAGAYASVGRAHAGFLKLHPEMDLEVIDVPLSEKSPAYGSFAVAKNDGTFLELVDEVLKNYIGSEKHRNLMAQFGFNNSDIDLLID